MRTIPVQRINPLDDPRWLEFIERHPRASVFHTPEWLAALRRTYGYELGALTLAATDEPITNGIVFCEIRSWLTGCRIVSLPFSDHCQPLVSSQEELDNLASAMESRRAANKWRYVELRSLDMPTEAPAYREGAQTFCFHRLDLRPSQEELYRRFHKDCIQRKIRRAQREALTYEHGRSEDLLQKFYGLFRLTRRRQRVPPQPITWFRNLITCMGDNLTIRVASKDDRPVASILTLRHKHTVVYKYGCSDKQFSSLGGTQLLFWKTIEEAKQDGLLELDLGRSAPDNDGLIEFKERWGARRSDLTYQRSPARRPWPLAARLGRLIAQKAMVLTPEGLIAIAGRVLYRHLG